MLIVEDKVLNNSEKLKFIVSKLDRLATLVSQISRTVAVLQFSDGYLGEGTLADRQFAEEKIREIITILAEIDKINMVFESRDLSAPQEKQRWLNRAIVDIDSIRSDMLELWGMRNSGDTSEDNKKIQDITKKLFENINRALKRLQKYVDDFNAESHVKLNFRLKWTPLPK